MEKKQEIQQELVAIAPMLASLPRPVNPELPVDYFLRFRNRLAVERHLQQIAKPVPAALPSAYIAGNREQIFTRVRQWEVNEELNQMASVLLSARQVATIPDVSIDFHQQREKIWRKVRGTAASAQKGEAVALPWLDKLLAWLFRPQYAFAWSSVSVALLLYFLWQFNPPASAECASLACLPDQEIEQYIRSNADEFDEQMLNLPPDNQTGQQPDPLPLNENDVKDYLRETYDNGGMF